MLSTSSESESESTGTCGFNSRRHPWRGVSLGGWLLLEPGPSYPLFEHPRVKAHAAECEWAFMEALDREEACQLLKKHRETHITKQDFVQIKNMGLNAVRVPFGYWLVTGPSNGDIYEGPALEYLDRAVQWAGECGLQVLLDLHGCPGGESADAPSGRMQRPAKLWKWKDWRFEESLAALKVVVRRYCGLPHVTGIAVCNEPSRTTPSNVLCSYYDKAVRAVRAAGMNASQVAVVLPVFQRDLYAFADVWKLISKNAHKNVCFEHHYYHCFEDSWNAMTLAQQLRMVEEHVQELRSFPSVVGEWSLALGAAASGGQVPKPEAMALFGAAQLAAYSEASHGWFFWTWKDGNGTEWDLRASCRSTLLPGVPAAFPLWSGTDEDPLESVLDPLPADPFIRYGQLVCLRAFDGHYVDVDGSKVSARWCDRGDWQTFVLCPAVGSQPADEGGRVRNGDVVRLLAHTGACIRVNRKGKVTASLHSRGFDEFLVHSANNCPNGQLLRHRNSIHLQCRKTGLVIDADSSKLRARWKDFGDWQTFIVEIRMQSGSAPGAAQKMFQSVTQSTCEASWNPRWVKPEAEEKELCTPSPKKRKLDAASSSPTKMLRLGSATVQEDCACLQTMPKAA